MLGLVPNRRLKGRLRIGGPIGGLLQVGGWQDVGGNGESTTVMPKERVLVTGGGGYLGLRLAGMLWRDGADVTLFDLREPIEKPAADMKFIKGDVTNYKDVEDACRGVDCVYHIASYGMSGREQKIEFGDESLPYLPLHKHPDYYSMTKSMAEMEILKANGTMVEGGGALHTCALRPAGIYGPGEQRHLPRIVSYIEQGLFAVVYGEADSLVEFVHVDNLAKAHALAGRALQEDKQHIAAGQAYFISDGKPVNNFEFFRPLVEGLGYTYPTVRLPVSLIYFFGLQDRGDALLQLREGQKGTRVRTSSL
ncbi:hypothetical protein Bbelb_090080 [Branchiostoma belcheri]|nr:hypothetical protein Bbelb_090080 [Branchiostoma belcheri]